MRKRKRRILSILLSLILPGLVLVNLGTPSLALPAAGQTSAASSAGAAAKKLSPDDLALYIYENGTANIHVRNANTGYKYALLDSSGKDLSGWQEPKDGRVIFENQKTGSGYSVVFCPDQWADTSDPSKWEGTTFHFDISDYDDAIDKTFVNPQDVERSKDGTIIWIYATHQDCEYALYDFYTDQLATEWKDGVAGVVVFTGLKPYRDYNVRARIKGTGPKPEIIPDKPLPMPGADVIVGECSFDDLSGYGLIHVWATPGYGYAILGEDGQPLSAEDMLKWDIFVKDQYEIEVDRGEDGYYRGKEGGRITFSVPAGGTYKLGGKHPDGDTFVSQQKFQVKAVNKNYWFEYVVPKGSASGFYRLVIYPACPYSIYKLSAIHSFIHFIDRYGRVQPGGDNRVIFSPVNGFLEYVITAQPVPLTLTESPEDVLFGNDLWESDVWGSDSSAGDVSGGDVSGGDVSGGDASSGDIIVKMPLVPPEEFDELTDQDVRRSEDGKEITVYGSDGQQYALADPITNMRLGPWHDAENGEVKFHSLDPKTPYLILTQIPGTEDHTCVFQPNGVYAPGIDPEGGDVSGGDVSGGDVSGGDVSGGDVSGGDAGGSDEEEQAVHLTLEMFQSINGGISSNLDQSIQSGDTVLYSIIAENHGNRKVSNAVITDSVPEGMTLKEGSISGDGVYNPDTRTITWNINLGSADSWDTPNSVSLQFRATVDRPYKKTSYDNMAYIEQKGASIDSSNMVHASTSAMTIAKKTGGYKDPESIFLFTLYLNPPPGQEIDTGKIVCSDGKTAFSKSGEGDYVAYFALSDEQQIKFIGLPAGTTYRIKENSANLGRDQTTVKDVTGTVLVDDGGEYGGTGKIPSDGTDIAVFFLNIRRAR